MKKVGILLSKLDENFILYRQINDYLLKNNVLVLAFVPPVINDKLDYKKLRKIINQFDGVILEGGRDFDKYDLAVVKYLYDNDIPTLGICLGMQMMSCLFNGKMIDLKGHQSNDKYAHFVYLDKHSKLYKILKKQKILVNSRHKSVILKTDLKVNATSNVIEAVSDDNKKFFMGVQWHPESLDDINTYKLFKAFFQALKKN